MGFMPTFIDITSTRTSSVEIVSIKVTLQDFQANGFIRHWWIRGGMILVKNTLGSLKFRQSSLYWFAKKFITAAMGYKNMNPEGRTYSEGLATARSESFNPWEGQEPMNGQGKGVTWWCRWKGPLFLQLEDQGTQTFPWGQCLIQTY